MEYAIKEVHQNITLGEFQLDFYILGNCDIYICM
jgi:hypothetical protein